MKVAPGPPGANLQAFSGCLPDITLDYGAAPRLRRIRVSELYPEDIRRNPVFMAKQPLGRTVWINHFFKP